MGAGTQEREAEYYREMYLGDVMVWTGLITDLDADLIVGVDLSSFDSVHLLLYATDDDASALKDVTGAVLTDTDHLYPPAVGGTQSRVKFTFTPTTGDGFAADTEYKARVVGFIGSAVYPLSKPWSLTAYASGPSA